MHNKITVVGYRNATLWRIVSGLQKLGYSVGVRLLSRDVKNLPRKTRLLCRAAPDPATEWELLMAPASHAPTPGKKTIFAPTCITHFPFELVEATLRRARFVIIQDKGLAKDLTSYGLGVPTEVVPLRAVEIAKLHKRLISEDSATANRSKLHKTCIVQLGKFGDLINVLPICKAIYDRDGKPPVLMVAKKYKTILDGVSYVEPEIFYGDFKHLKLALAIAREKYQTVVVSQIYGGDHQNTRDSYNAEAWGSAGYAAYWGRLPLEFDRASIGRERMLLQKYLGPGAATSDRPLILFNGIGESSPFPVAADLLDDIRRRWQHRFDIVDLSVVKAHRIYDLLGFYQRAMALITIDTATLHLAWATPGLPVVALISDRDHPWQGSRPPGNCKLAIRYLEVAQRREEIHQFIATLANRYAPERERVFHVTSETQATDDARRRNLMARETWQVAYQSDARWRQMPITPCQLPRLFEDGERRVQYFKDLIDFAVSFAHDRDFIVFTNADICLAAPAALTLAAEVVDKRIGFGNRREIYRKIRAPISTRSLKEAELLYGGVDMFVFPVQWWKEHRHLIPDMVIGSETWDLVMREYILEQTRGTAHRWLTYIYHEHHLSYWLKPHRFSLLSRNHNVALAADFYSRHGKGFDQCFVINLDKRADRLKQVTEECARVKIPFERFPGIIVSRGTLHVNAAKTGCRKSHIGCVQLAKERGYWSVLVLEDDVQFVEDFVPRWRKIVVELEKFYWDIFLIGCQHFGEPSKLTDHIAEAKSFSLGHAYIVHSRAYDGVIAAKSNPKKPCDLALSDACAAGKLKALMAFPSIALQRESWSDNDNRQRRWEIKDGTCNDPEWPDGVKRVDGEVLKG
jgi:hypothetical protein